MNSDDETLRYPVGRFTPKENYTREEINQYIAQIQQLPGEVEKVMSSLKPGALDIRYREHGWTARQVLHHLPDSHLNAYIRFKWTLTESTPTIKAYDEKAWAETPDTKGDPTVSLNLLTALHGKWTMLLQSLDDSQFKREFIHPDTRRHLSLARMVATYAWHGQHHLGHLKIVAEKPVK
jgi:hypothetical protein